MSTEMQSSDAEFQRVCELILQGQTQFYAGNYLGAEQTFVHLKGTAQTDAIRNRARIYLGIVFDHQYNPCKFRDPAEDRANKALKSRAICEYEDVLGDNPTPEQKDYATRQLSLISQLREVVW